LPGDSILLKFASESAINAGDNAFALNLLKPFTQTNPNDWQAVALLIRACAESGDTACRDLGMAHMLDLHHRGLLPPRMQQYIVERIKVGDNSLLIRASLEPWGNYKVYDLGQVSDPHGTIFLRATVESSDVDQAIFAKSIPKKPPMAFAPFHSTRTVRPGSTATTNAPRRTTPFDSSLASHPMRPFATSSSTLRMEQANRSAAVRVLSFHSAPQRLAPARCLG
jgi:hypothetical protein